MRFIPFIKPLTSRQWISCTRIAMLVAAAVVIGIGILSGHLIGVRADGMNDSLSKCDPFEYLSSFLEVMIALNVSGLFRPVRGFLEDWQRRFLVNQVKKNSRLPSRQVDEEVVARIQRRARPIYLCMKKNANINTLLSQVLTVAMAIVLTVFLLLSVPRGCRPYMVLAVCPVGLFFAFAAVNQLCWRIRLTKICKTIGSKPRAVDDAQTILKISDHAGPIG